MAFITRIKTNQISDGNVTAAKIASGTLVGSLFAPTLSLNSNITILGNLTVAGNTSSINSVNTYVQDPLVVFNNGYTGSMAGLAAGIIVNRNYATLSQYGAVNTAWVWVENDQAFESITTTTSGNALTTLTSSGFANLKVGNITAPSVTSSGTISAGFFAGTTGSFTTLVATNFSSGNAVISSGYITGLANLQTTNMTSTTSVATNLSTGNAVVSGGYITGLANLQATNISGTTGVVTNFSSGNVLLTGGAVNGLSTLGATTGVVTNFSSGNVLLTGGAVNGLSTLGATTGVITNFSSGNTIIGTLTTTTSTGANFSSGNAVISGGYITGLANLQATNISGTTGVITNFSTANLLVTSLTATTFQATNFSTGNAVISGGYITGLANLQATNISGTTGVVTNFSSGNTIIGTLTTTTSTGANFSSGNVLLTGGAVNGLSTLGATTGVVTNFSTANAVITNESVTTGVTTNFSSGNARISGGYADNFAIGANTAATGAFTSLTNSGVYISSGNIVAAATTASTSATTGALVVKGGVGIGGDAYIAGNLSVNGTVTYINTTTEIVTGAEIVAGNLVANSGTTSSSTTTGALVVAGGAGISGALNVGGTLTAGAISNTPISGSTGSFTTAQATNFSSGNAVISGGYITGLANLQATNISGTTGVVTNFSSGNAIIGTLTTTTSTGANFSSGNVLLTGGYITGLANLQATNISGTTGVVTNFSSSNTIIGTLTTTTSTGANFSSGNAVISGGYISALANVNATVANFGTTTTTTLNSTTGNITNIGTSNIVATVGSVGTLVATTGFSTANAIITNFSGTTGVVTNFSTANAVITGGSVNGTPIGASTASTGAFTTLSASGVSTLAGNLVLTSSAATNNNTTGALVVTGSGGIAVAGNVNSAGQLFIGSSAQATVLTSAIAVKRGTSTTGAGVQYTQDALINVTNTGSSDFIAYANNYAGPNSDHGWVDVGFTGDAFSDPVYSITKANDAYVFGSAANATVGGNLVLSTDFTGSYNDIVIGVGGFYSNSEVARFHGNTSNSGYLNLAYTTNASPAANTGALRVQGGASVASNVYVGGASILNGSKTAGYDTVIKGKNDDTLIWARPNATYDTVIIGGSATAATVINGVKLNINSTDSLLLPMGTSAQRPGVVYGTDVEGMFRYSKTLQAIEWYNGTAWKTASTNFTIIADEQFAGDGATVTFTLSTSQTTSSCIVSINGVVQIPTLAYAVSGTTLTFTEAPAVGDVIDVRELTTTVAVTSIADGAFQIEAKTSDGINIYTGVSTPAITTKWVSTGAEVNLVANVTVGSASTLTTLDSFSLTAYSSAEYLVTSTIAGTNIRQIAKVLVVTDGVTAYVTTFGVTSTSANTLATFSGNVTGGNVNLGITTTNASTINRVRKNYQAI